MSRDTRQALTFDEWFEQGYRIKKGEKSAQRNSAGKSTFTMDQVWFVPVNSRSKWLVPPKPPAEVLQSIAQKKTLEEDRHNFIDPTFDPFDDAQYDDIPW